MSCAPFRNAAGVCSHLWASECEQNRKCCRGCTLRQLGCNRCGPACEADLKKRGKEAGMKAERVEEKIEYLPVGDIHPSANYRKSMDQAKLAELTESVKEQGVLQPITVRKNAKGFEIVYGERRWRAAKAAGHQTIPSIVRVLTDDQALEMAIVENDQREDPNPMDQAIGYKMLLDRGKHDVESLAAKLDKTRNYVESRLRLLKLPKAAQEKLRDGSIPVTHALYLTRLRNEGDMNKLMADMISQDMSLNRLKEQVQRYSTEMSRAIFDTTACGSCAARSKAQVGLFPDAKQDGDRCMDRSCFFTKTREHYGKEAAALRNMGVKVYGREKDFDAAFKKLGKSATLIATSSQDSGYQTPCPAKWKTQCAKCDKRAFAYYEERTWQGNVIKAEWACLEKKCLDKMNRIKSSSPVSSGSSRNSSPARTSSPQHAIECRDRFIYREIAPRVEKSEALRLRLAIYHLFNNFDDLDSSLTPSDAGKLPDASVTRRDLFKEITGQKLRSGGYSMSSYFSADDYAAIAAIPEKKLPDVLQKVAMASVRHTESEVLLLMAPEAGVDLNKSLVVDKKYLDTKTKAELVKLAKTLGINARSTTSGQPLDQMSKPEMLDEIMKYDLTGKLPKDIADRCELKTLANLGAKKGKA